MSAIPFPAMSAPGRKAQETGGRLRNCYAVEVKGAPASQVLWQRSAGLRRILEETGHTGCRGMIGIGSVLVHVLGGNAYAVTQSGGAFTAVSLGTLSGTEPITVAQNNASPTPDTVCVTENGAFNLFAGSAPSSFADGDLATPNSVTELDGYLIFSGAGGRITATELNSVSVASNSYVDLPEGNLLRVVRYNDEIIAFGSTFMRVYRNEGLSPFPLAYAQGTRQDIGIAGTHAVAGYGEGWSDALIFAANDGRVYRRDGYQNTPISTPDVSRSLESVTDKSLLQAAVYMTEGDAFWSITAPGQFTWEYNLTTGLWNERASYGRDDWRGRRTIWKFDRWIVGDDTTGDLMEVVAGHGYERSQPLIYELWSGIVSAFPMRLNAVRSFFRFTAGTGVSSGADPIETDPRVEISVSLDGGYKFGKTLLRKLGGEGDSDKVVSINNTGISSTKGLQYQLRISDPVHAGFMGGDAVLESVPA